MSENHATNTSFTDAVKRHFQKIYFILSFYFTILYNFIFYIFNIYKIIYIKIFNLFI